MHVKQRLVSRQKTPKDIAGDLQELQEGNQNLICN